MPETVYDEQSQRREGHEQPERVAPGVHHIAHVAAYTPVAIGLFAGHHAFGVPSSGPDGGLALRSSRLVWGRQHFCAGPCLGQSLVPVTGPFCVATDCHAGCGPCSRWFATRPTKCAVRWNQAGNLFDPASVRVKDGLPVAQHWVVASYFRGGGPAWRV